MCRQNYQKEREAREAAERQRREMEAQLQAYKIEAEKAKEGERNTGSMCGRPLFTQYMYMYMLLRRLHER